MAKKQSFGDKVKKRQQKETADETSVLAVYPEMHPTKGTTRFRQRIMTVSKGKIKDFPVDQ